LTVPYFAILGYLCCKNRFKGIKIALVSFGHNLMPDHPKRLASPDRSRVADPYRRVLRQQKHLPQLALAIEQRRLGIVWSISSAIRQLGCPRYQISLRSGCNPQWEGWMSRRSAGPGLMGAVFVHSLIARDCLTKHVRPCYHSSRTAAFRPYSSTS